mmetsp:Transcript_4156/g.7631  ORF Transcript_4156/g.7631 Transcript_4156/m.7631 type:complete len:141 (+) Transcript_4156:67-489(+)
MRTDMRYESANAQFRLLRDSKQGGENGDAGDAGDGKELDELPAGMPAGSVEHQQVDLHDYPPQQHERGGGSCSGFRQFFKVVVPLILLVALVIGIFSVVDMMNGEHGDNSSAGSGSNETDSQPSQPSQPSHSILPLKLLS